MLLIKTRIEKKMHFCAQNMFYLFTFRASFFLLQQVVYCCVWISFFVNAGDHGWRLSARGLPAGTCLVRGHLLVITCRAPHGYNVFYKFRF